MKKQVSLAVFAFLLIFLPSIRAAEISKVRVSVDLLSDTGGVNLQPYLSGLVGALKNQWVIQAAKLPATHDASQRETLLDLTLAKDGHLLSLRQQGGESNEVWSKVAWDAAKSSVYLALPSSFTAADLKMRLHFSTP